MRVGVWILVVIWVLSLFGKSTLSSACTLCKHKVTWPDLTSSVVLHMHRSFTAKRQRDHRARVNLKSPRLPLIHGMDVDLEVGAVGDPGVGHDVSIAIEH